MAGNYLQLQRAILGDQDFLRLTDRAKWTYLVICLQPSITPAGVTDLFRDRLALEVGCTVAELDETLAELEQHQYICCDPTTFEIAVRTYNRHDVNPTNRNMVRGSASAWMRIKSRRVAAFVWPHLHQQVREAVPSEHHPNTVPTPSTDVPPPVENTPSEQSSNSVTSPSVQADSNSVRTVSELPRPDHAPPTPTPRPANPAPTTVAAVIDHLADRELDEELRAGKQVKRRDRYRAGIRGRIARDDTQAITALLAAHPDASVEELSLLHRPHQTPPAPSVPFEESEIIARVSRPPDQREAVDDELGGKTIVNPRDQELTA